MKVVKKRLTTGKVIELQVPETEAEKRELRAGIEAGKISDRQGFAYKGRKKPKP